LIEVDVLGNNNGEEKVELAAAMTEASHADDRGEGFRLVKTRTLAASFGHEASLIETCFTLCVQLNLEDTHGFNDRTVGGEVNKFPRAIVHEGVIIMLHCSLPVRSLSACEGGTVRGRLYAVRGRYEGNVRRRRTRREMRGASDECRHVGMRDVVLGGFGLPQGRNTWQRTHEGGRTDEPLVRRGEWGGTGGG
jgi:hypothetical protein